MVLRGEERGVRDDGGGGPETLVERVLKFIRDERCAAKRASALIVLHPAVKARAVEDMTAVSETTDLRLAVELIQADGAAISAGVSG